MFSGWNIFFWIAPTLYPEGGGSVGELEAAVREVVFGNGDANTGVVEVLNQAALGRVQREDELFGQLVEVVGAEWWA